MAKAEPSAAPERKWLPRTPYLAKPEAGRCQVCGMEDAKRFKIGVGTAWWNGNPVHDACEQWITTNPDGRPATAAPPPSAKPLYVPLAQPEPAPHPVMLRFPGITAAEVQDAKLAQRGGRPLLVTAAKPGDNRLCMYGLPDIPKYLYFTGEAMHVAGGGPLEGGFTLVILVGTVKLAHAAGTLCEASSEPPHPEPCECPACDIDRLNRATATMFGIPPHQIAE